MFTQWGRIGRNPVDITPNNPATYIKVEVEKGTHVPPLTNELKDQLTALGHNPAFQYLSARLAHERAELKRQLEKGFTLDEQQLHFLQSGIFYCSWLEDTIARLTHVPRKTEFNPTPEEVELFEKHQRALEVIE